MHLAAGLAAGPCLNRRLRKLDLLRGMACFRHGLHQRGCLLAPIVVERSSFFCSTGEVTRSQSAHNTYARLRDMASTCRDRRNWVRNRSVLSSFDDGLALIPVNRTAAVFVSADVASTNSLCATVPPIVDNRSMFPAE